MPNYFSSLGILATNPKQLSTAEEMKIHVVAEDAISNNVKTEGIIAQIERNCLTEWGANVCIAFIHLWK